MRGFMLTDFALGCPNSPRPRTVIWTSQQHAVPLQEHRLRTLLTLRSRGLLVALLNGGQTLGQLDTRAPGVGQKCNR